jgi:hypothetical protein
LAETDFKNLTVKRRWFIRAMSVATCQRIKKTDEEKRFSAVKLRLVRKQIKKTEKEKGFSLAESPSARKQRRKTKGGDSQLPWQSCPQFVSG